jgi:hypothetical protein
MLVELRLCSQLKPAITSVLPAKAKLTSEVSLGFAGRPPLSQHHAIVSAMNRFSPALSQGFFNFRACDVGPLVAYVDPRA